MPRIYLGLLLFVGSALAAALPTPEQFAGFRMGADKKLVRWDKVVEYMKMADTASDRIQVQELGKTSNGNPYINVVISAPQTIADLERYRGVQKRIAYPQDLAPNEFEAIAAQHKAVLLITCNIHASEIGASQMVLELVHRLATEDSAYVKHVLDNVIFLLVPSANPDGQIMIVDWYNKNVGTPYEYSALPELYHKYTGHDNNRDAFMNTQLESRMLNKLTYRDWLPQVYLDEHQMGSNGARIFVPPFKDPVNPNVDPTIWQLNGMLGYAMGAALHEKGYTGIINDAMYTSWWQGGFVMQAWWHNMVGVLTEVASVAIATPIEQEKATAASALAAAAPEPPPNAAPRDPKLPLPAPRDVTPRNTYPRPWTGGKWTLRDIVDYELTATYGLLQAVADNRLVLLRNFYQMNRRAIEAGKKEAPYAWVIPADQHDRPAAARMAQILDEMGVEVHQAGAEFEAGGRKYAAGSYVVKMAQPFRAFAKDLLEKQKYPEQRATPGGPVERPYDVTGWTLPLQMGVDAVEVAKAFDAKLESLKTIPIPAGKFEGNGRYYEVSGKSNHSSLAANRLLKGGSKVWWTPSGFTVEGKASELKNWASSLGVDVAARSNAPAGRALKPVRLAIYHPSLPNMDEGWTRWLLEQYEFPFTAIGNEELRKGGLQSRFDAILFADQPKDSILKGVTNAWTRPEFKGGIGDEGVAALKDFVKSGGTLITLGTASLIPVEEFPLPLKNALKGLRADQFSCPGSILKVFVDNSSPVGFGMRDKASAVFYNDIAFEPAPGIGESEVRVVARYPSSGLLESGWIGGEQYLQDRIAAADVKYGKGRVIVLGFSVQNRAQPHGTFKLLFNAIHVAGTGSGD